MAKYKTTIMLAERNGEIAIEVEYAYHKGDPGRYSGPPEKCYPSEPAYVEIISVMHGSIDIADYLSDEQTTTLEQEIEAMICAKEAYEEEQYYDGLREDRDLYK